MKSLLGIFLLLLIYPAMSQDYDFVVAADGSGDFTTVQSAIDAVPHLRNNRTTIFIKPGTYKERLMLAPTKVNVSFVGEDPTTTIITFDSHANMLNRFGEKMGTSGSSMFYVYGDGFEATNITFENSAGPVGQAVAVRVDGDRVKFDNCRFLGNQDTLYPHGKQSRQYYKNCYIEGTVDFIFGWSTAYFDKCEIFCKTRGYITAASTEEDSKYGFVFNECKIGGSAPAGSFYLGRPWRPYAQTVFINCEMSEVIKSEGWDPWGKDSNKETAFYAEYGSKGKGGNSSQRVDWSHQLTNAELANYSLEKVLGDWNPNE